MNTDIDFSILVARELILYIEDTTFNAFAFPNVSLCVCNAHRYISIVLSEIKGRKVAVVNLLKSRI